MKLLVVDPKHLQLEASADWEKAVLRDMLKEGRTFTVVAGGRMDQESLIQFESI